MATAQMSRFLRRLTRGIAAETLSELTDRQLLERLLAAQDETVFEALVRRHGPMVYRVCWRVLQQAEDTEDAFQATFLLLARKLQTVRKRDSLASWLHGVAHRVALDAKAQVARRRRHEARAAANSHPGPPEEITWTELRTVLDSELGRLPEKWRLPLILCYLEGRSQQEAATQLGWSKSTLLRRLDEARAALGRRLTGRGVVWPAALSAVLLSDCVAPAALAPGLVGSTVEAAACLATGQAALTATVSANVAALTEGVLKTMFTSKLKIGAVVVVLIGLVTAGAGIFAQHVLGGGPAAAAPAVGAADQPKKQVADQPALKKAKGGIVGVFKKIDAKQNKLTFTATTNADTLVDLTYPMIKGVKAFVEDKDRKEIKLQDRKEIKLQNLKPGMKIHVCVNEEADGSLGINVMEIGVPMFMPDTPEVRKAVLAHVLRTPELLAAGEKLIADLSSDTFAVREKATRQLADRFEMYKDLIQERLKEKGIEPEVQRRLQDLIAKHPDSVRIGQTVAALNLLEDPAYLVALLDHVSAEDAPRLIRHLQRITGQNLDDAAAWREWAKKQVK